MVNTMMMDWIVLVIAATWWFMLIVDKVFIHDLAELYGGMTIAAMGLTIFGAYIYWVFRDM